MVLIDVVKRAWPSTLKTTLWLLKIMLPVSLIVRLFQFFGFIDWIAQYLDSVFVWFGLPSSAAFAFISGAMVGTYGGLAAMLSLTLTLRQATIVAIMILICHSLPMECAVMRKTGSSFWLMGVLRVIAAFVVAGYLNLVMPEMTGNFDVLATDTAATTLTAVLTAWCISSVKMSIMVFLIIYGLMIVQRLMETYHIIDRLVKPLHPLMRLFGLPEGAAYLWLVGNVLGVSYGSAVMMDLQEQGVFTPEEGNEVNYHLIMNHSLFEDTLTFAAVGISAWWIISTRVLFAMIFVWGRKGLRLIIRRHLS